MRSAFTPDLKLKHEEEKRRLTDEKFSPLRGDKFTEFISELLSKQAKLPGDKVKEYLAHIDIFEQAFTHISACPEKNYEAMEILGDATLNFCVVQYLTQRFPQLMADNGSGVSTIARLKINLISKDIFAQCSEKLGFGEYIASDMLSRRDEMPSLLEDTFEAFAGAIIRVSGMCDPNSTRKGYLVSLGPVYRIISTFFDSMEISLKYEDLYDAKTRLKQYLEANRMGGSTTTYVQELDVAGKIIFTASVKITINGRVQEVGIGKGFKKAASEQTACETALVYLKRNVVGYRY
jgi:dsRNA-specific ribonuclease